MTLLPNLPPIPADEPPPATGSVASAVPPNDTPPLGPELEASEVFDLSDEEFRRQLFKENHGLPLMVLGLCGGACLLIAAGKGYYDGGGIGAAGMSFVSLLLFVFALTTGTMAAWIVGKLFDSDFGSFGGLLIRVGALVCAHFLAFIGLSMAVDIVFVVILGLPVLLALAIWLLGMNPLQAFLFSITMSAIAVIALSVLAVSLVAALGPAGAPV